MKSLDEIKAFYQSATVDTNPAQDRAILTDALQAGQLQTQKRTAHAKRSLWRAITTSRMAKLTAAGILVAAAILGVRNFNGTVVRAVEFAEITKAMEQVPWMRVTPSESSVADESVEVEQWFGFESKVQACKWATGDAVFESVKEQRRFAYNLERNTIIVTYLEDTSLDLDSPMLWLDSWHKILEKQGAKVTARMGNYQGYRVQIQEISQSTRGEQDNVTLYIDPDTKRLYGGRVVRVDTAGKVTVDAHLDFDYPLAGPGSIYDLGVPRDAKIVSNMPGRNVRSMRERCRQTWGETSRECGVMERYWQTRDAATREYIAVITHNTAVNITDAVNMIDVDYKSGRKHRQERHSVFDAGQTFTGANDESWKISEQRLGTTFESMLAWSQGRRAESGKFWMTIHLYDGQYDGSIRRDRETGWGRRTKHYRPEGSLGPEIALGDLAWPQIHGGAQIIQDEYATQHKLICFERLQQGLVHRGTVNHPGRFLYYLDPAWGYLCRRKVTEWRPNAQWQKDKDWLVGVDPEKIRDGSITVTDITEASQAPNGHWYPKVIVEQQSGIRPDYKDVPLMIDRVKRIYLDLSPEFSDGIFDIDRLPKP